MKVVVCDSEITELARLCRVARYIPPPKRTNSARTERERSPADGAVLDKRALVTTSEHAWTIRQGWTVSVRYTDVSRQPAAHRRSLQPLLHRWRPHRCSPRE